MWNRRPTKVEHNESEAIIDRRDKSIRVLIDELISGTQELKSLYTGDKNGRAEPT